MNARTLSPFQSPWWRKRNNSSHNMPLLMSTFCSYFISFLSTYSRSTVNMLPNFSLFFGVGSMIYNSRTPSSIPQNFHSTPKTLVSSHTLSLSFLFAFCSLFTWQLNNRLHLNMFVARALVAKSSQQMLFCSVPNLCLSMDSVVHQIKPVL